MATGDKVYIADKPTLDSVNSKLGESNNSGGSASSGSIFAKLNALISSVATHVASWTSARAAKMDNLDVKVSTMETEAQAAARYNALINKVAEAVTASTNNRSAVKSIQRGILPATEALDDLFTVTISAVDPAKCVVLFDNRVLSHSNPVHGAAFISLTATTLTVRRPVAVGLTSYVQCMWQIVEYY